jgi:hypothetical protein
VYTQSKPTTKDVVDHLPGLLKSIKPPVTDSRALDEKNQAPTYVGFSATNVKFDGASAMADEHNNNSAAGHNEDTSGEHPAHDEANPQELHEIDLNAAAFNDNPDGSFDANSAVRKLKFKKDPVMDELRSYIMLMDKFSLHNFVIYEGRVMRNTPEFESFHRSFIQEWGSISGIIAQLEDIMTKHDVKLAIINGPKLYKLASLHIAIPTHKDLMDCVANIEQVEPQMEAITQKTTGVQKLNMRIRATIRIQGIVRRKLAMIKLRHMRREHVSVTKVQSIWRLAVNRMRMRGIRRCERTSMQESWDRNQEKLRVWWRDGGAAPATNIDMAGDQLSPQQPQTSPEVTNLNRSLTAMFNNTSTSRNNLTSSFAKMASDQRLIIHIPSVALAEQFRLGLPHLQAVQNCNISALYQLADKNVHLLYVVPFHLSAGEQTYYERFVSMLGINIEPKRLHFVVPELIHRLPQHMSLAQMLWFSARALQKIRLLIRRFDTSIIIPAALTWAEKRIAHYLDVPMLSPEPTIAESLTSRSMSKKLFIAATMNIPVGAHDLHTHDDLLVAITRLIACNLDVKKWVIRLNNDHNGEGVGFLDVSKIKVMPDLRNELDNMIAKNNLSGWFTRPMQLAARKRLLLELRPNLEDMISFHREDVFPGYDSFIHAVRIYGAVVEAEPLEPLGIVEGIGFIDPLGAVQVYGCVDVITDRRRQALGFMYPQCMCPTQSVTGALTAIMNVLFAKHQVIGYVTVRFISHWDAYDKLPRLWATDLKFGMTPTIGNISLTSIACSTRNSLPKSLLPPPPEGNEPPSSENLL